MPIVGKNCFKVCEFASRLSHLLHVGHMAAIFKNKFTEMLMKLSTYCRTKSYQNRSIHLFTSDVFAYSSHIGGHFENKLMRTLPGSSPYCTSITVSKFEYGFYVHSNFQKKSIRPQPRLIKNHIEIQTQLVSGHCKYRCHVGRHFKKSECKPLRDGEDCNVCKKQKQGKIRFQLPSRRRAGHTDTPMH